MIIPLLINHEFMQHVSLILEIWFCQTPAIPHQHATVKTLCIPQHMYAYNKIIIEDNISIISIKFIPTKMHLMFASSNLMQPRHLNYSNPLDFRYTVVNYMFGSAYSVSFHAVSCVSLRKKGKKLKRLPSVRLLLPPVDLPFGSLHFDSSSPIGEYSSAFSNK
jgi:hypothetical protein